VIPSREDDKIFDVKYYSRDHKAKTTMAKLGPDASLKLTRVHDLKRQMEFMKGERDLPKHPLIVERPKADGAALEARFSKGMDIPDVKRYDKTGLRAYKTATWDAYRKSLLDDQP